MGTRHQGSEQERRALDAYIKLMRAADSVTGALQPLLAEAGLTLGQLGVLEVLMHLGPLPQHELASKLLRSSGNTSVVLANLERAGLVQRRRRHEDRRVQVVSLTPRGQQLIGEVFPRHAAALARRMAALSPREQETLGALCRKLGLDERASERIVRERAVEAGSGPAPRRGSLALLMASQRNGG
ncbi:MAG TPA: MarR family transcriptional regulator [Thermoanaerobaculaceae bacterium]|nr:MarR family transcriptional regulator [Thermoanaerobaculaceae bacterium]HRS15022.1 MarR family transcriptional regulator [Thermoanaerobaculaceae bacterium]